MEMYTSVILPYATGLKIDAVLTTAASIVGGIIALVFLIYVAKDAFNLIQGNGKASFGSIITKLLIAIFLIGVVFIMVNYQQWGEKGKSMGTTVINTVENVVKDAESGR